MSNQHNNTSSSPPSSSSQSQNTKILGLIHIAVFDLRGMSNTKHPANFTSVIQLKPLDAFHTCFSPAE